MTDQSIFNFFFGSIIVLWVVGLSFGAAYSMLRRG